MLSTIPSTLASVSQRYHLEQYRADRALIIAPFGQRHFDEGIERLTESTSVVELAKQNELLVVVITSTTSRIGTLPEWITCIQVDPVPDWPSSGVYQNRFFKWAIPLLFPNISCSIYLDSDLIITAYAPKLLEVFRIAEKYKFFVTDHVIRKGWLDEYKAIVECKERDRKTLERQKKWYLTQRLPKKGDVFENNFLARVHGSEFDELNLKVLEQLAQFSERDQLALVYAVFQTQLKPFTAPEGKYLYACHVGSVDLGSIAFVDNFHRQKFYDILSNVNNTRQMP